MIKYILILFITLTFIGCNINNKISHFSDTILDKKNDNSSSANYLTANYSITKGDPYTANQILDRNLQNQKLLEIKFISSLVSGKFETANKVSNKLSVNNHLHKLPKYILHIKKGNFKESLDVFKHQPSFFNLDSLNDLIRFWIDQIDNKNEYLLEKNLQNTSIHTLLILENFHDSKKLTKIADAIYKKDNLNIQDTLLLAGFYFRVQNIEKTKKLILTKLSNQFDKPYIIKNFSKKENTFNKIQTIQDILAFKIYNTLNEVNLKSYTNHRYQKILLEFSLFLNPKMDVAKYSLAEIYNIGKMKDIAIRNLNKITKDSFFFLAANLKKLTIIKTEGMNQKYKTLLFKIVRLWPRNKLVLYRLANYHKFKNDYLNSLKIYKKILKDHETTDKDLFLYASNLDKVGRWEEAKVIFLELLDKNPEDTYTLNYLSYKFALKEQELDLALKLIKKALILDPENGYFLDTLGWVEFKRKNYQSAVYFLEKSVSILPTSFEIIDHLGDCYFMLNRKKEAFFEWKKALKYAKDDSEIKKIKEKISKHEHIL